MRILSTAAVAASLLITVGVTPAAAGGTAGASSDLGAEGAVVSVRATAGAAAAADVDTPIRRSEVLKRAKTWAVVPIRYSMYVSYKGYRTDCSGFVSMAWRLGRSATTGTFGPYTYSITKSELKPGDILDWDNKGPGVGHVVMFEKWADAAHSSYWAYEQTPGHTKHRVVPYPYFPGHGGPYRPLRYINILNDTKPTNMHDVNADLKADMLARDNSGAVFYYRGKGNGTFAGRVRTTKKDWSGYNRLLVGDLNGDGKADVLGRNSQGQLYYYRGKGSTTFASRVRTSSRDWSGYNLLVAADVNGGGRADVLARDTHGALYYHHGKGDGTFSSRIRTYTSGFSGYESLLAADVSGDGQADLLARDGGAMYYYRGKGDGTFASRVRTSTSGWDRYTKLMSADVNGDGEADVLARDSQGALYYLRGKGNGTFVSRVRVYGSGWNVYNSVP
jgi:hypothetical protein